MRVRDCLAKLFHLFKLASRLYRSVSESCLGEHRVFVPHDDIRILLSITRLRFFTVTFAPQSMLPLYEVCFVENPRTIFG